MRRVRRLLRILAVAARYRLDTFLRQAAAPRPLRALFALLALLPEPRLPRGERLRRALEELGPIFVKFGQMLSTRPDLIPEDVVGELSRLQDQVPPFPVEAFAAVVEGALGRPLAELFARFDREPLASASVAQVHAAVLPDGREVVVKVIRPGIRALIELDTALLLTLARFLERISPLARRLHPVDVARDWRFTLLDELDLRREAANTSTLRRNFEGSELLYVPEVIWEYTAEQVLTLERIRAVPVTDLAALARHQVDLRVLAERGVEIFFTQVFEHNFFHADMHPGNIFVNCRDPARPSYVAVDCAIIGSLTDEDRHYLARNLLAIFRRDYRQVAELHVLSGWVPPQTRVADFEAAIRTVCEPIFARPLGEIAFARILVNLFRTAQRFEMEVQPGLVLLQKTLIHIEGLGRQLYPQLDLWATAQPFLERWMRSRTAPRALLGRLERHGPDWLERLPRVPELLFAALQQSAQPPRPRRSRRRSPSLAGASLLGFGAGLAAARWPLVDPLGAALAAAGLLLLLVRR